MDRPQPNPLEEILRRLERVEQHLGLDPQSELGPRLERLEEIAHQREHAVESAAQEQTAPVPAATVAVPPTFVARSAQRQIPKTDAASLPMDWERLLAGRVFAWAGGGLLILAVAYLTAVAIGRGWLGEGARIALAFGASAAIGAVGAWAYERKGQTPAALAAVGVALAGGFCALTAGSQLYDLFSLPLALLLATIVGVAGVGLAHRWGHPMLAGLAMGGCLLAPWLVGGMDPSSGSTETSVFFLLIAAAATNYISVMRGWPGLTSIGLAVALPQISWWAFNGKLETSCAIGGPCYQHTVEPPTGMVLLVVGLFWLVFQVGASGAARAKDDDYAAVVRPLLASAVIGWLGYSAAEPHGYGLTWLLGMATAHLALALAGQHWNLRGSRVASAQIGAGLISLSLALSLALSGVLLAGVWAMMSVIFAGFAIHLSLLPRERHLVAVAGGAYLGLSALHLLSFSASLERLSQGEPLHPGSVLVLTLVALLIPLGARWLEMRNAFEWTDRLGGVGLIYMLAWAINGSDNLFQTLLWLSVAGAALVALSFHPALKAQRGAHLLGAVSLAVYLVSVLLVEGLGGQSGQVALSAWWALAGLAGFFYGLVHPVWARLRPFALGLLCLALAKVTLYDLAALDSIYRVLSAMASGALLLFTAFVYQRQHQDDPDGF